MSYDIYRFYPFNTLFNLPEACLFADLVVFFEKTENQDGTKMSYSNVFQDIRLAMDFVHLQGQLKSQTLENLPLYLAKNKDMNILFMRLKKAGFKLMLITNSEYYYTEKVMSYLLNDDIGNWKEIFDIIIVAACKPLFFLAGTTLREVNLETGNLMMGKSDDGNSFKKGHVYQGGNIKLLESAGVKGNQVLYIGDHIYADIIRSKKTHAWRTLLVIPELENELRVTEQNGKLFDHLANLEFMKTEAYKGLNSESLVPPDLSGLRRHIKQTVEKLNESYNPHFGSLFGTGSKLSYFGMQVQRYADLYSCESILLFLKSNLILDDWINLLNYPLFYYFTTINHMLPHIQRNNNPHTTTFISSSVSGGEEKVVKTPLISKISHQLE